MGEASRFREMGQPLTRGRPRHAPWTRVRNEGDDRVIVERHGGNIGKVDHPGIATIELDATSNLVWRICDGKRSISEICELFIEAYSDERVTAREITADVQAALQQMLDQGFLVLDGGGEVTGGAGTGNSALKSIVPGVELQWQLETLRRFLFGVLRVEDTETIETNFEAYLGAEALARAKQTDADSVPVTKDSKIISYGASMTSPSFAACVNAIIAELEVAVPESKDKLELSGNAIFPRGVHMGWHSNHSRADRRIYCIWCEQPDTNFFRYEDPATGEIITEWEQPGWNIRTFAIPPRPARFWHCIGAASLRLTIGFRFP